MSAKKYFPEHIIGTAPVYSYMSDVVSIYVVLICIYVIIKYYTRPKYTSEILKGRGLFTFGRYNVDTN